MKKSRMMLPLLVAAGLAGVVALVGAYASAEQSKDTHVGLKPTDLKWMAAPEGLPQKNAQAAVLEGDPGKSGFYAVRLKSTGEYMIRPHWHSQAEHITVIQGTFYAGMGDSFDQSAATAYPRGSYLTMPAKMHHFAYSKTPTIIQITGQGPFDITYVNSMDDPRHQQGSEGGQGNQGNPGNQGNQRNQRSNQGSR